MNMRARVLAIFAIAALALPVVWADPPMTKVQVEVRTLSDKPVERASVVVRFVEGRSAIKLGKKIVTSFQTKTNQDGIAKIPELPQGKLRVQVIAKGYQTFGDTFEVEEAERTILVKLNPPQPQYSAHQ